MHTPSIAKMIEAGAAVEKSDGTIMIRVISWWDGSLAHVRANHMAIAEDYPGILSSLAKDGGEEVYVGSDFDNAELAEIFVYLKDEAYYRDDVEDSLIALLSETVFEDAYEWDTAREIRRVFDVDVRDEYESATLEEAFFLAVEHGCRNGTVEMYLETATSLIVSGARDASFLASMLECLGEVIGAVPSEDATERAF